MLRNIVHHKEQEQSFCDTLELDTADGGPWRDEFIDWVSKSLGNSRQYLLSASFIDPALHLGHMGFVKKADDLRFHLARVKVLQLEGEGRIEPLCPIVRSAMRRVVENSLNPN